MKKLIVVFSSILLFSCYRKMYDRNYQGGNNYRSFYIVDTITIIEPVVIDYKGGRFVVAKKILESNLVDEDLVKRPDVFIMGHDLYQDMDTIDYERFAYKDYGGCNSELLNVSTIKSTEIYEFTSPKVVFILGLINVNSYNKKHNTYNYYPIDTKEPKNSFFKIVYPLCLP
jgi:hypothetical protein